MIIFLYLPYMINTFMRLLDMPRLNIDWMGYEVNSISNSFLCTLYYIYPMDWKNISFKIILRAVFPEVFSQHGNTLHFYVYISIVGKCDPLSFSNVCFYVFPMNITLHSGTIHKFNKSCHSFDFTLRHTPSISMKT